MFKSSSGQGDLNGFIDAGSHIEGKLCFEDTFRIDGKVTGSVISDGELIVGDRGEVDGEVKASRVFVSGIVRGVLRGEEKVEITSSGKVLADVFTPSLKIEQGAHFEGRCTMGKEEPKKKPASADRDKVTKMPIAKS